MEYILINIGLKDRYKRDRLINDYVKEWKSHNIMYKLPFEYFKKHCKDCDLTNNESKFRLFVYNILGRL